MTETIIRTNAETRPKRRATIATISTRSIWLVSVAWIGIASTIHGAAVGGTTAVSPS